MAALITYCSTVLGSLMTDFGKASKAEANFRIALYKRGQSWVSQGASAAVTALPHRERVISGRINNKTLLSAEGTKEEYIETFS